VRPLWRSHRRASLRRSRQTAGGVRVLRALHLGASGGCSGDVMSENQAAYYAGGGDNASAAAIANAPDSYDHRRLHMRGPADLDPHPLAPWRLFSTFKAVVWCFQQQPDVPMTLLDISAGVENLGAWAKGRGYEFVYHATEQSPLGHREIKYRVPDASVAIWRCEQGGAHLADVLEHAEDTFLRQYPVCLVSHGVEHFSDPYLICDEAWSMVRPGGFLVLVSAREHHHRTHFRTYDLGGLVALAAHYVGAADPIAILPGDYWTDLVVMIPKPHLEQEEPPSTPQAVAYPDPVTTPTVVESAGPQTLWRPTGKDPI